jgi:hypothetical protein
VLFEVSSRRLLSALGPTVLRARKPKILDCLFMSLSLRDLLPEMMVLEVPDIFAIAIAPTPSTAVLRSMVTSARTLPVANPRMTHSTATTVIRRTPVLMESPAMYCCRKYH